MRTKIDKILAYKPDVFINRQLIYNYPEQLLAQHGIMVIEHADFDGVERLSAVLGAEILSTFDQPDEKVLGTCEAGGTILPCVACTTVAPMTSVCPVGSRIVTTKVEASAHSPA